MSEKPTVYVFGEVLFDMFIEKPKVIGGAPFNVAWALHGMRSPCKFISSIGKDEYGRDIKETMEAWGMDLQYVQEHSDAPTGLVSVDIVDGEPKYEINTDVAFDRIEPLPEGVSSTNNDVLYHGSLIYRHPTSRETLNNIKKNWNGKTFVDVNVRHPWFDIAWLEALITGVDMLKVNDEELSLIRDHFGYKGDDDLAVMQQLMRAFNVKAMILTKGSEGVFFTNDSGIHLTVPTIPTSNFADAVGAGDAFSATMIHEVLQGSSLSDALERANGFAKKVCEISGATTHDLNFYHLQSGVL